MAALRSGGRDRRWQRAPTGIASMRLPVTAGYRPSSCNLRPPARSIPRASTLAIRFRFRRRLRPCAASPGPRAISSSTISHRHANVGGSRTAIPRRDCLVPGLRTGQRHVGMAGPIRALYQKVSSGPPDNTPPQPGDSVVTTSAVNFRIGPTTSAAIITTLPMGTAGTVLGGPTSANGYNWYQLQTAFGIGWCASSFLRKTASGGTTSPTPTRTPAPTSTPTPTPIPGATFAIGDTVRATTAVNLRASASTSGGLAPNTGDRNDWHRLGGTGQRQWICLVPVADLWHEPAGRPGNSSSGPLHPRPTATPNHSDGRHPDWRHRPNHERRKHPFGRGPVLIDTDHPSSRRHQEQCWPVHRPLTATTGIEYRPRPRPDGWRARSWPRALPLRRSRSETP